MQRVMQHSRFLRAGRNVRGGNHGAQRDNAGDDALMVRSATSLFEKSHVHDTLTLYHHMRNNGIAPGATDSRMRAYARARNASHSPRVRRTTPPFIHNYDHTHTTPPPQPPPQPPPPILLRRRLRLLLIIIKVYIVLQPPILICIMQIQQLTRILMCVLF